MWIFKIYTSVTNIYETCDIPGLIKMKPHSDCFNVKLNHASDLEKLLGENFTKQKQKTLTL